MKIGPFFHRQFPPSVVNSTFLDEIIDMATDEKKRRLDGMGTTDPRRRLDELCEVLHYRGRMIDALLDKKAPYRLSYPKLKAVALDRQDPCSGLDYLLAINLAYAYLAYTEGAAFASAVFERVYLVSKLRRVLVGRI